MVSDAEGVEAISRWFERSEHHRKPVGRRESTPKGVAVMLSPLRGERRAIIKIPAVFASLDRRLMAEILSGSLGMTDQNPRKKKHESTPF